MHFRTKDGNLSEKKKQREKRQAEKKALKREKKDAKKVARDSEEYLAPEPVSAGDGESKVQAPTS